VDLIIHKSQVQISLWNVGTGPSGKTINQGQVKEISRLKAVSAKHRSKFAALSLIVVTAAE
jgi:hypothetical protein